MKNFAVAKQEIIIISLINSIGISLVVLVPILFYFTNVLIVTGLLINLYLIDFLSQKIKLAFT
ncbi:MAG: hypothetical protein N2043_10935 [Ignavibacterium sp.]|nr:hypothetical protein [Ignavibacterium sp.]